MKIDIPKIDFAKLREGKKVICPKCKEGIIETPYNPKTSKFFKCNKCNFKINID